MATAKQEAVTLELIPPGRGKRHAEAPGTTYLLLKLSPEMNGAIEDLMRRTGLPKADVLNMAVGLLKASADAVAEGKRVGIVAGDQELDMEFVGL